ALVRAEVDRLDAGLGLALACCRDDGRVLAIQALQPHGRVAQYLALRVGKALPGIEIDQHVHLDAVERGLEAIFRHLLPAEIENPGHWPAITVDHAAFERGIDLTRRCGDRGAAERLHARLVNRRRPNLP